MTARAARVTAHAKINLILRVLAREESGFHTLETLFARLAIGDVVTVRIMDSARSVICNPPLPGPPEQNLAWRAAEAFAESTGWPKGFALEIEKRIPIGGGLGGGSADAGAVLRALAALSPNQVREADLLSIASSLGSDVPYLATTAPLALAWGRGERMLALPPLPERDVLLVVPSFPISTAAAYSWLAAPRVSASSTPYAASSTAPHSASDSDSTTVPHSTSGASSTPASSTPQLLSLADLATWHSVASLAANDFEPVVSAHHPEIGSALSSLRDAGAAISLLSGSGSTLFGIFDSPPEELRLPAARVLRTRTLAAVSPVEVQGGEGRQQRADGRKQ